MLAGVNCPFWVTWFRGWEKNHERDIKRPRFSVRMIIVGLVSSASAFDIIHPCLDRTPVHSTLCLLLHSSCPLFHNIPREWQTTDSLDDGRTPVVKLVVDTATLYCRHQAIYCLDDPKVSVSCFFPIIFHFSPVDHTFLQTLGSWLVVSMAACITPSACWVFVDCDAHVYQVRYVVRWQKLTREIWYSLSISPKRKSGSPSQTASTRVSWWKTNSNSITIWQSGNPSHANTQIKNTQNRQKQTKSTQKAQNKQKQAQK